MRMAQRGWIVAALAVFAVTASTCARAGDVLSAADLAKMKTERADAKNGTVIRFTAAGAVKWESPDKQQGWKAGEPIPVRITCTLTKISKGAAGRPTSERLSGMAKFYLLDEGGQTVLSRSRPLDNMCLT